MATWTFPATLLTGVLVAMLAAPRARAAESTQWTVRSFDTEHGLPGPRVLAIAQSSDGFLWVGTSGGLARFDGARFQTVSVGPEKAQGDADVTALEAEAGRLFYCTRIGSYGEVIARRAVPLGMLPGVAQVLALLPQEGGELWAASSSSGVWSSGNGRSSPRALASRLPAGPVTSLVRESSGRIWALAGNHLVHWDGDHWQPTGDEQTNRAVDAITPGARGGLWIATASAKRGGPSDRPGIWFQSKGTLTWHSTLPNEDPAYYAERIAALFEDHEGRLWCAVRSGGLFYQEIDGRWVPVGSRDMLARVTSLFEDAQGVIWAATESNGLCRISRRLVTDLRAPTNVAPPVFWTTCATRDGSVWGGSDGAGLFRWRPDGSVQSFGLETGMRSGQIPCLLEARDGTLFAGTRSGLYRFDGANFTLTHPNVPQLRTRVTALHQGPDGTLWAATDYGLAEIGANDTVIHGDSLGLQNGRVRDLATDHAGVLHAAVFGAGLFRRGEDGRFAVVEGWTAGTSIRGLCSDPERGLWITTSGRWLFHYDGTRLVRYGREEGVPNQYLNAATIDHRGNLWLGTDLGLVGVPLARIRQHESGTTQPLRFWKLLGPQGLPNKAVTGVGGPIVSRGPDGRLWFPNGTALAGLNPALLPASENVRTPVIEELLVGGLPVAPDRDGTYRIPHRAALTIDYTSPDTFYPERLSFRTRLAGRDDDWKPAEDQRRASYPELAPGRYTFHAAVSAPGGDWVEAAASPVIEIVPHFWDRRSTRTALALLAFAAVAIVVWRIEHGRNQRRLALAATQRALDAERQRIARDLHDELGAGLTDIIFAGDHLAEDLHHTPRLAPDAERIAHRARELARSIEEVVWSVDPTEDTADSFLTRFQRTAQEHLSHAGIAFRWDAPLEATGIRLPVRIRHSLLMAGKESITNAIKHAGASEVRVRVLFDEPARGFSVTIEDDGRGFDPAAPPQRGYGLGGLRSRLEECGGKCQIDSQPGQGTRVIFRVPRHALSSP